MANYKYTQEHLDFIEEEFNKGTIYRKIARKGNKRFNTDWNDRSISYVAKRLGLRRKKHKTWSEEEIETLTKMRNDNKKYKDIQKALKDKHNKQRGLDAIMDKASRMDLVSGRNKYTEKEKNILKKYGSKYTDKELSKLMFRETKIKRSPTAIRSARKRMGIKKDYEIGFSKGHIPEHTHPIGHTYIDNRGYWFIKISRTESELLHRRIYRMKHKIELSSDDNIIFLDGNKDNLHIDNLKRITRSEHGALLGNEYRFEIPELTETGLNLIRLENTMKEKKEKMEEYKDGKYK